MSIKLGKAWLTTVWNNETDRVIFYSIFIYFILLFFGRNKTGSSTAKAANDLERIEAEYIKNLQQQVYFLELEANYLYPLTWADFCCTCLES